MAYKLGKRSEGRLTGLHPDLVAVVRLAISRSSIDFTVLEGMRTLARQKQLVSEGASKTMNSRHLTGHAVDIAPLLNGQVSWDWPLYHKLAPVIKRAAQDCGVDLEWGGDWRSFKDGPHWQLSWKSYPKDVPFPKSPPPVPKTAPQRPDIPFPVDHVPVRRKPSIWVRLAELLASFFKN